MPEVGNMALPPKLLQQGVTDMVRISDARMSGTAYGTVVLHVGAGGRGRRPAGAGADGDMIELDVAEPRAAAARSSDDELARRRAALEGARSRTPSRGYCKLYVEHVLRSSASPSRRSRRASTCTPTTSRCSTSRATTRAASGAQPTEYVADAGDVRRASCAPTAASRRATTSAS